MKLKEKLAQDFSTEKFPCEPPCDSYGVCENCTNATLIRVGYREGFNDALDLAAELAEQIHGDRLGGGPGEFIRKKILELGLK